MAGDLDDVSQYAQDLTWSVAAPRHQWIVEHNEEKHVVQSYLATISFVDAQLGKLLDALDESGESEDTIIVLWSDHGFQLGSKERWGKRSLWERATKVVLMISSPGKSTSMRCDRPVGLIDLYPTLIELCGLDPVTGLEGHSLASLLEDPRAHRPWPALTSFGQHNHAIRTQNWRYITYADGSEELYDRRTDPNEFQNLASSAEYAEVIARHRRYLPQNNQPMAPGSAHLDARPGSAPDIDSPGEGP
jgi:arylsulfatase A-like enzyme